MVYKFLTPQIHINAILNQNDYAVFFSGDIAFI